MKKQYISDRNEVPVTIGDLIFFESYPDPDPAMPIVILGKIKKIDGAYVLVSEIRNKNRVWELYSIEIQKADDEKAALWLLEN
jgi:hypothetical protein